MRDRALRLPRRLYSLEEIAGLPAEIDIASEYRYRARVHAEREVVFAVSQSGEIADTLAALFTVAVVAQMLADHVALARGRDVVQPRNLAKTGTVE